MEHAIGQDTMGFGNFGLQLSNISLVALDPLHLEL